MTSQKFEHAELPFGYTGRRSDDTLDPDYNPDDGDVVHYAPGDWTLCGNESRSAVYTDDPAKAAGCEGCLELAQEDLGRCRRENIAQGGGSSGGPARTAGKPDGEGGPEGFPTDQAPSEKGQVPHRRKGRASDARPFFLPTPQLDFTQKLGEI